MAKELYLYSPIYDFVAENLISSMEENKAEDIIIRSNTPGGSVFSGWGIIAKMGELQKAGKKITIKADGAVMSMGAVMLVFADNVEALDVSSIMLHRAAMFISSPEDQVFLDKVNKDLKAKLISKIDGEKLKEIKGVSIDELFNSEKRIDLYLTAKEAKSIGLVNKITSLNAQEVIAMNERYFNIAAKQENKPEQKPLINKKMTIETFKSEHPEIYAAAVAKGIAQEKDRTGAWLAFVDIDATAVAKGIKDGADLSATAMAELSRKSFSADALNKLGKDAPAAIVTKEVSTKEVTEKEKNIEAFATVVKAELKK